MTYIVMPLRNSPYFENKFDWTVFFGSIASMAPIFWLVSVMSAMDLMLGGWFYYTNSQTGNEYQLEYQKYLKGDLYWWQVRNDEDLFLKKLEHCKNRGITGSLWTSVLCKVQSIKTSMNYYGTAILKVMINLIHKNSHAIITGVVISAMSLICLYYVGRTILRKKMLQTNATNLQNEESTSNGEAKVPSRKDEPPLNIDPPSQNKPNISRKSVSSYRPGLTKNQEFSHPRKTTSTDA